MDVKLRILIAEDDAASAQMLAILLRMNDYEVEVAPTAGAAVAGVGSGRYAAALLDLTLPGMTTAEFVEAVGRLPVRPPLVVYSARSACELVEAAAALGAVEALQKPADIDVILSAIADAVNGHAVS